MKIRQEEWESRGTVYIFYCEGCKTHHYADKRWSFNGDFEKPTFSPSILVEIGHYPKPNDICHSFVKDGKIQYLSDCTHHLAGQTVELLDEENYEDC
jgi:hypothetical protein